MRILVVDDEADIVTSIQQFVTSRGFEAHAYTDPQKALADFRPDFYDLVILDIKMPKMNGFQLYRELIKKDASSNIFFLSAFEEYRHEFRKAFPELEEGHFIKKPISGRELMERMAQIAK